MVSALIGGASWLLAGAAGAPLAVFAWEVLAGLWPARKNSVAPVVARTVILIPAHDEAGGIAATLAALLESIPNGTRVLVVADNCSDATASLAAVVGHDQYAGAFRDALEQRGQSRRDSARFVMGRNENNRVRRDRRRTVLASRPEASQHLRSEHGQRSARSPGKQPACFAYQRAHRPPR